MSDKKTKPQIGYINSTDSYNHKMAMSECKQSQFGFQNPNF